MNTKNEIAIFDNEEFGQVRVMGTPENPWFVASDVATALGYKKPRNAVKDHVDDEDKTTALIQGSGSNYKTNAILINESGVYALIMGSKLERAKKFKRWVTSEVLPAIRKQGYYGISHELTDVVKQLADQYGTICNAIELMAKTQQQTNEVMSVVADTVQLMAHHIMKPQPTTTNLQPNQNQTTKPSTKPIDMKKDVFTATEICGMLGYTSARSLNNVLTKKGIIQRENNAVMLTPEYENSNIAVINRFIRNGKVQNTFLLWTNQGIDFLRDVLK
jgi:prophage antirepressor-like protein